LIKTIKKQGRMDVILKAVSDIGAGEEGTFSELHILLATCFTND
jgi:hypothetical protein